MNSITIVTLVVDTEVNIKTFICVKSVYRYECGVNE